MFWKIVIIVLCLLWCLPIGYVWNSMKKIKNYEEYLEDETDYYDATLRAYHLAVEDTQEGFKKFEDAIENQRKIVNGWQHKINILDEEIRKLKKELSKPKE